MGYLLDTNVLSELRKAERCHEGVRSWVKLHSNDELYISVLSIAEIRDGIERRRQRDPQQAHHLEIWLHRLKASFGDRVLPVTMEVAERSGRLFLAQPLPQIDRLIAATAIEHDLELATRNTGDFERAGVTIVNPWETRR